MLAYVKIFKRDGASTSGNGVSKMLSSRFDVRTAPGGWNVRQGVGNFAVLSDTSPAPDEVRDSRLQWVLNQVNALSGDYAAIGVELAPDTPEEPEGGSGGAGGSEDVSTSSESPSAGRSPLSSLAAQRDALQREVAELESRITSIEADRAVSRKDTLADLFWEVLDVAMGGNGEVGDISEGVTFTPDDLRDVAITGDPAVRLSSGRIRKGAFDWAEDPAYRNPTYREAEVVILRMAVPRGRVAETLKGLES